MSRLILDEGNLRGLPPRERLDKCFDMVKNETDESLRWDAVWLAGEIAETSEPEGPLFAEVANLMAWVLKNESNGVVKHEACYQIAARNMRNKIPDLIDVALKDASIIARHEAIESLGLMRAFDVKDMLSSATKDVNPDVRETALFVHKRLERLEKLEESRKSYKPSEIL